MAYVIQKEQKINEIFADIGVSVIKFSAKWCAPCKKIAPEYANLVNFYPIVSFYSVDIEDLPRLAETYNIRSVPTFLIISEGKIINVIKGANIDRVKDVLDNL